MFIVSRTVFRAVSHLGRFSLFFIELLASSWEIFRRPMEFIRAFYNSAVLSLPIILLSGLFVGMVLALQAFVNMQTFGAESATATLVALALMRELGAVVSALLFAGRAGSAITAEIGLMQATEQLAAIEMMGIEPIARVGVSRFYGAFFALPALALIFVAVAMMGGYFVGTRLGLDGAMFWAQLQRGVEFFHNIFLGVIVKSLVFGALCAAIAVYYGFYAPQGAQGLGLATTKTVVSSSLAILAADFLLTALMFGM
ncbi:MAG: ABC transporter permease [Cardiobacteriaceae bacterium]|nr:ABC transporter permease [Cardiobacteriaceae bacterium]